MIAKIEQVTTDPAGNLAIWATYWEAGQQVNSQRHAISVPVSRLVPVRNADGLLVRLDGEPIPAQPTAEEQALADQIGVKQEVVATDPAIVAEFAARKIKEFAQLHRLAVTKQAHLQAASDAQVLALAAGRAAHWAQVQQVAQANGDQAEATRAARRLALAQSGAVDAQVARALANEEIAPMVAVLNPETPWTTGTSDPRGYLAMPQVLALLGTEWEC